MLGIVLWEVVVGTAEWTSPNFVLIINSAMRVQHSLALLIKALYWFVFQRWRHPINWTQGGVPASLEDSGRSSICRMRLNATQTLFEFEFAA